LVGQLISISVSIMTNLWTGRRGSRDLTVGKRKLFLSLHRPVGQWLLYSLHPVGSSALPPKLNRLQLDSDSSPTSIATIKTAIIPHSVRHDGVMFT
jgi:hypothetical protein